MKISGYGISNNNKYKSQTNFKQSLPKTPTQQAFIDLMKSNDKMYKSWKSVFDYDLENVAEDMKPTGVPLGAICHKILSADFVKEVRYAMGNLLKSVGDVKPFKYKALEKIYNNQTIMEDENTRNAFVELLGKRTFNWNGEYTPEQETLRIMSTDKTIDNKDLKMAKILAEDESILPKNRDEIFSCGNSGLRNHWGLFRFFIKQSDH